MKKSLLKDITGKKIRRQYFNVPLIILYDIMLFVPYTIFVVDLMTGKFAPYDFLSDLWISIWVCFCFSLPILLLRTLNKHFFGRIICVFNEEGIYYADKKKLRWETIKKIEYAIGSNPRRTIIYTQGGWRIVLEHTPMYIVSRIKKYRKEIDVRVSGVTSLLKVILIFAAIELVCPFYIWLIQKAPGASYAQYLVLVIIWICLGIIRNIIFDIYYIPYRFWSRILPKKCLSYIMLGCYYPSFFVVILILCYFPNWVVVALLGIYMGIVQPPVPSKYGIGRYRSFPSYDNLYETYITKSDFWQELIAKRKNRIKKK